MINFTLQTAVFDFGQSHGDNNGIVFKNFHFETQFQKLSKATKVPLRVNGQNA